MQNYFEGFKTMISAR